MSNPFRDPSIGIRALALSAAIFGISLGLCGLNLGASFILGQIPLMRNSGSVLSITGIVEIGGMAIGAAGIALSVLALLIQIFWRMATRKG